MGLFGDDGASDVTLAALNDIKSVPVPTADDMKVALQKLVQVGVLTPEQVQTFLQGPSAFDDISTNPVGKEAMIAAIGKLNDIVDSGGMDAQEAASLAGVIQNLNTQQRGQRGAILQNAAERGTLSGGETLAAQLEANQSDAANANANALQANASAEERALQALTSSGELGHQFETQQFGEGAQKASAADAIAKFNADQAQQTAKWNAANNNAAEAQNLSESQRVSDTNVLNENTNAVRTADLPQRVFQDKLAKTSAEAGSASTVANLEQSEAEMNARFVGNLIGAGAGAGGTALTSYLKGQPGGVPAASDGGVVMKDGGIVPGKARVPGDSPRNDTVPALLSPGEVVVPRTAAQRPDSMMAFLSRMRQPKIPSVPSSSPHPADVATVLKALSHVRGGV